MIRAALLAGIATVAWQSSASAAVSMSMNRVMLGTIANVDACVAAGEATFSSTGLRVLERTASAAWAQPFDDTIDQLYAVYCLVDQGIAVIIGSGDDLDAVDAMVVRLVDGFGRGGTSPGVKPR